MSQRDQISIHSQSILWVAGVGVALLTLAFVLGVQVGKQSAALRQPANKGVEADLKDLPEPLLDQLKIFEGDGPDKLVPVQKVDAAKPPAKPEAKPETKPGSKPDNKPETKSDTKPAEKPKPPEKTAPRELWTLQLLATSDAEEAQRMADKVKTLGFSPTLLRDNGQVKLRLAKPADRPTMDKHAETLKRAGFSPFAVRVQ